MIQIEQKIVDQIEKHAGRDYPHECGGMLVGHFAADGRRTVVETFPLENAREEEDRHNRVLILPKDVQKWLNLVLARPICYSLAQKPVKKQLVRASKKKFEIQQELL